MDSNTSRQVLRQGQMSKRYADLHVQSCFTLLLLHTHLQSFYKLAEALIFSRGIFLPGEEVYTTLCNHYTSFVSEGSYVSLSYT